MRLRRCIFPGLKSHQGHELIGSQMASAGAVIAFELKGGYQAGVQLLNQLEMIRVACEFGGRRILNSTPSVDDAFTAYTRKRGNKLELPMV